MVYASGQLDAADVNGLNGGGGGSSETPVVTLVGTAIPEAGRVYLYTPTAGDVITFFAPTAGVDNSFELDVVQGETAASFTLPNVTWVFGTPDLSAANKTTRICFRYVSGEWQAWSTPEMSEYLKKTGEVETIDIFNSRGSIIKTTAVDGNGFWNMSLGTTSNNPRNISFNSFDIGLSATHTVSINSWWVVYKNHDQNTAGGFVISDATTGAITSPGDVIATVSGSTVTMSSLDAAVCNKVTTDTTSTEVTIPLVQGGHQYKYGELTALTITAAEDSPTEALVIFDSGTTATVLNASSLKWINGVFPTIEANATYCIGIQNGLAVCGKFATPGA